MSFNVKDESYNVHGGAVLADDTCGVVSLSTSSGGFLTFNLTDDPEFTMSGLYEPCSSFDQWC